MKRLNESRNESRRVNRLWRKRTFPPNDDAMDHLENEVKCPFCGTDIDVEWYDNFKAYSCDDCIHEYANNEYNTTKIHLGLIFSPGDKHFNVYPK